MKNQPEIIGFMIQGEDIIVANPCTIPIEILEEQLKKPRKKGIVTTCMMIKLPLKFSKMIKKSTITGKGKKVK